jgi:hypothetical protein
MYLQPTACACACACACVCTASACASSFPNNALTTPTMLEGEKEQECVGLLLEWVEPWRVRYV